MSRNAFKKIKSVAFIFSDFDGVMTDDRVLVDQNGKESVFCSRADGLGLGMLKKKGIPCVVISKERNPVAKIRCKKLKIKCFTGVDDKLKCLLSVAKKSKVDLKKSCFVGNDVTDIECMKRVGFAIAPKDAHPAVRKIADYVTKTKGGEGVFREVADVILG